MSTNSTEEKTLNNKWVVLAFILVIGIMLFSIMARIISNTTYKKSPSNSMSRMLARDARNLDSVNWNEIENFNIPPTDKLIVKLSMVRVCAEASIINGKPVLTSSGNLNEYVQYIDRFYSDKANADVPLFFAVKIADMAKGGANEMAIQGYRNLVLQKLRDIGIIKN